MPASTIQGVETLLSPDEAAQILGISRRTLEGYVRAKKVPFVKMGHLTKFRPTSLQHWIEAQEQLVVSDGRVRE
jgi:excisionase family DNA binding protein